MFLHPVDYGYCLCIRVLTCSLSLLVFLHRPAITLVFVSYSLRSVMIPGMYLVVVSVYSYPGMCFPESKFCPALGLVCGVSLLLLITIEKIPQLYTRTVRGAGIDYSMIKVFLYFTRFSSKLMCPILFCLKAACDVLISPAAGCLQVRL